MAYLLITLTTWRVISEMIGISSNSFLLSKNYIKFHHLVTVATKHTLNILLHAALYIYIFHIMKQNLLRKKIHMETCLSHFFCSYPDNVRHQCVQRIIQVFYVLMQIINTAFISDLNQLAL